MQTQRTVLVFKKEAEVSTLLELIHLKDAMLMKVDLLLKERIMELEAQKIK